MKTPRKISIEEISWTVIPEVEYESPETVLGFSENEPICQWIRKESESSEWAWCCVKVTGKLGDLRSSAFVGGCSYFNESEFRASEIFACLQIEIQAALEAKLQRIANEFFSE